MVLQSRAVSVEIERIAAPAPCPSVLLASARQADRPFILKSGAGDPPLCGWSYGALEAIERVESLAAAERAIARWALSREVEPPFFGGAVGYLGYDAGWALQPRPREPRRDPLGMPPSSFHLYDAIYARSEATQVGFVIAQPNAAARARAGRLIRALDGSLPRRSLEGALEGPLRPSIPRAAHLARIERALELIRDGEIYQVNLTYPLQGRFRGAPEAAFLRLVAEPPPFAAFVALSNGGAIVSASPECFFDLDVRERRIAVYPIKGTRRRGATLEADRALEAELSRDDKERAEHLMIVDLLRNDLGRVAAIGSVEVPRLAYIESFPTVHHLTSRVVAKLRDRAGAAEVVRALFPGGSVTGVPKLRAMEVIDALEEAPRGVYTGAIAYLSPSGAMRASIAIRTAQIAGGELRFGVGGGIVHDSIPEREWDETELKARALGAALLG